MNNSTAGSKCTNDRKLKEKNVAKYLVYYLINWVLKYEKLVMKNTNKN